MFKLHSYIQVKHCVFVCSVGKKIFKQLSYLLVFVYGQTSTGDRKLDDEHYEQDHHVLEVV